MKKLFLFILLFLVLGGLVIGLQTPDKATFGKEFLGWVRDVSANIVDATGHAVRDYQWLPKVDVPEPKLAPVTVPSSKKTRSSGDEDPDPSSSDAAPSVCPK